MKSASVIRIAFALIILFVSTAQDLSSIPAFARKYQISCQVCHSPALPRLKPFGDDFAGNGFRMTEYESPRYFIQTGDDRLSLLRELPVAVRIDGFATYNSGSERADFGAPYVVKLLSGGEISDKLSYYFYFLFNERGTIAGLEDAFLMYHDLFGTGVNLSIGQFQVSDPLFKGELRYTLESYAIYGIRPGMSTADLKYDKGILFDKSFKTGTTVVGEIVNGNGIGEADGSHLFDKDNHKNFMLRVNQQIGKYITVGVFGYTGKENISDGFYSGVNEVKMFGPDITFDFNERFIINAQYVKRLDSFVIIDGFPSSLYRDVETQGGFAEVIFAPKGDMSKWYLTGLVNWVDSDLDLYDYSSATLHAGYLIRRNMRLVGEYSRYFTARDYGKASLGIVTAF